MEKWRKNSVFSIAYTINKLNDVVHFDSYFFCSVFDYSSVTNEIPFFAKWNTQNEWINKRCLLVNQHIVESKLKLELWAKTAN